MPYESKAQAAYLHINEPKIAAKWDKEGYKAKSLPEHVKSVSEHLSEQLKEK